MSSINLTSDNIREEITKERPSSSRILNYLREIRASEEFKTLNDSDYYDIVGKTFKLNPKFFMTSIYPRINSMEMAKYIVKKFCLYDGESIIYEFQGDIKQVVGLKDNIRVSVKGGTVFITNYRIIAQGKIEVKGHSMNAYIWGGPIIWSLSGGKKRAKSKGELIDASTIQELPCYGYQFKSKAHVKLEKKRNAIKYIVIGDVQNLKGASAMTIVKAVRKTTIKLPSAQVDELHEILSKDVEQVIEMFQELQDLELNRRMKRNEFLYRLRKLWESEEYRNFTDSDYLDVVAKVYELDPELFMKSIYPKMRSWNFPSFLRAKEKIISTFDV
jgi:hypothetical protein